MPAATANLPTANLSTARAPDRPCGAALSAPGSVQYVWLLPSARALDRRTEPKDVAVEVDENTFVLSPLSVFRGTDICSDRSPRLCQLIGVVDPEVRRTRPSPRIGGHQPQMDLNTVTGDEAVATFVVLSRCEAKTSVVFKGEAHVADGKNRRDPLEGSHSKGI